MNTLNITARQFKALVSPVLPHAGTDRQLPVLNTVRIETRGRWLVAIATDRFRIGLHRQERPEGSPDDWTANVPLDAVKGIINTFAPKRGVDADLTLGIDGETLTVTAAGALVGGFFDASFRWPLETGEFPGIAKIVAKALNDEHGQPSSKVNMQFLSAFRAADIHGAGMWVRMTGTDDRGPVVVTDGENFVGMVMPRRGGSELPDMSDWAGMLTGDTAAITAAEPVKAAS